MIFDEGFPTSFCSRITLFGSGFQVLSLAPAGPTGRQWHGRPLRWLCLADGAGRMSNLHEAHDSLTCQKLTKIARPWCV